MIRTLREETGWAENTVRTPLTRLVDKGAVQVTKEEGSSQKFSPVVKREECVKAESASFLDRIFQGAAQPLLVHFARNARLGPEEVAELKKILDQQIAKNPKP